MPERSLKLVNRQRGSTDSEASVEIPDKLFFSIGEVCKLVKVEPYVLRFWESEFPRLKPAKGPNGRRMYRKRDIETVLTIKHLLYDQGFTIAGARKALASGAAAGGPRRGDRESPREPERPPSEAASSPSAGAAERVRTLESELRAILTILNRRC
ncbi:MAG: MerR family transcriptional regulator [Acidobacteriota bacterium]|nr:MerR family transcriptional regulator [Acidobacteriota bacterium]